MNIRRTRIILAALLTLCLLVGCGGRQASSAGGAAPDAAAVAKYHDRAVTLANALNSGDNAAAMQLLGPAARAAFSADAWPGLVAEGGAFAGIGEYAAFLQGGGVVVELTLVFAGKTAVQHTLFGADEMIEELRFYWGKISGGMREAAVTVDAGTGWPLDGILTLPGDGAPKAAVVLVHGSGPVDMDSTIGANPVFKDITAALVQQGLAVLRYNKRTYQYGQTIWSTPESEKMTLNEETVQDAVAAVNMLKTRQEIGGVRVFLVGHSFGGWAAPYIGASGAACDGYICLVSPAQAMWEVYVTGANARAAEKEAEGKPDEAAQIRADAQTELAKVPGLAGMTDEQALDPANRIFGLSAWYMRAMVNIDAQALSMTDGKPILVISGGSDRVVPEQDFLLWQEGLKGHPDATFNRYPGLNHVLGNYQGAPVPLDELGTEYQQRTPVDAAVLADMAEWLLARA